MKPYIDSGVIAKLYVREANSAQAAELIEKYETVQINPFHELEIRNTFRSLEGQNAITSMQRSASEHLFDRDIIAGRLDRTVPDWSRVFDLALSLSERYTAETLARSMDILHLAAAISMQSELLITGDRRQSRVAEKTGLKTQLIE